MTTVRSAIARTNLVSLASLDPNLTVEDIMKEFELTPHQAYIDRTQHAQDERREGVVKNDQ